MQPSLTTKNLDIAPSYGSKTIGYLNQVLEHALPQIKADWPLYAFIAAYFAIGYAYLSSVGFLEKSHFLVYFKFLFPVFVFYFIPFFFILKMLTVRRKVPERIGLANRLIRSPKAMSRYLTGIAFLTVYCFFIAMFTAVKSSFGIVYGFQHDVYQADFDQFLFFGTDPWHVLFTPIHSIYLQPLIEFNYNMVWHLQTYAILFFIATSHQMRHYRMRYLFSFMLVWVLVGNVFAGLFISAGPAFYGEVTGDHARFGEQLAVLGQFQFSSAVEFQKYLWDSYLNEIPGFGTGISAFPSVHVSLATLNVFFAFEVSRRLGWAAFAYAMVILVSSVYLAWHYLVDGLFGALVVAVIYFATKWIFSKARPSRHRAASAKVGAAR